VAKVASSGQHLPGSGGSSLYIKDILVHVDLSPACEERVRLVIHLAHQFNARVTGLFIVPSPVMLAPPEEGAAGVAVATQLAELEGEAATSGQRFLAKLNGEDVEGDWHVEHGAAIPRIARLASTMDLVVLGQHDPDLPSVLTVPEDVVLYCGRPVLVTPYVGRFDYTGGNAIIAWNGSRASTRAAHDALPLLARKSVTVLSVNPGPNGERLSGDLVRHLARHGLDAKAETQVNEALSPAEVVLARVADSGADLVVMGAYGHLKWTHR
jgi:nucleotide-binding universal stress UspA family protein